MYKGGSRNRGTGRENEMLKVTHRGSTEELGIQLMSPKFQSITLTRDPCYSLNYMIIYNLESVLFIFGICKVPVTLVSNLMWKPIHTQDT